MASKQTAVLIVKLLGAFMLVGLAGTIALIAMQAGEAQAAIIAGLTGTALGGMTGLLAKTESDASRGGE